MATLSFYPRPAADFGATTARVLSFSESGMYRYNQFAPRVFKRSLDIAASLLVILLLAPIAALIALAIKLTSRGPVLFRQTRVGHQGKLFTMLKFRSMRAGSTSSIHQEYIRKVIHGPQEGSAKLTKMKNDPRITRLGRILRRTSLDELPQFLNVLMGDMSLVGPRPCIPYEFESYQKWHRNRVRAVPGLTGLWQVSDRENISFDEMVKLDLNYVHRWSIWLDLKILLLTPVAVLSGNGAH